MSGLADCCGWCLLLTSAITAITPTNANADARHSILLEPKVKTHHDDALAQVVDAGSLQALSPELQRPAVVLLGHTHKPIVVVWCCVLVYN